MPKGPDRRDTPPPLDEATTSRAMLLAMGVRNALEGALHGSEAGELGLTDEQMARLNQLVRNAIATGLHAEKHCLTDTAAKKYLLFQDRLIPDYWEPPELLPDYVELWRHFADAPEKPEFTCRLCGREIIDIGTGERARWTHVSAVGGLNVGCRAASFTPEDHWDDDIPRSWRATPER